MSNTFRRPMFRKGGDAMTGIMNNVTPRVNRAHGEFAGTPESYVKDYTQQLRDAAGDPGGVDPLTAWLLRAGPRMMNEPKRGGTLATILRATEEPTEQAIGDINKRAMSERDIRLAGAQLGLGQYGKEHLQKYKSDAASKETLNDLEQKIILTTEGYMPDTYTDRYHATNRATYDHVIQGDMIKKFGPDQIINVELVPAQGTGSRSEEKNKQKFYKNNVGKYYYDITDDTIKKIVKDPSDPTGTLLSLDTFNSKTLERIEDPVGDIDGGEEIITQTRGTLTWEDAQTEAAKRNITLIPPMPAGASRGWLSTKKRQNPDALTVRELEELIKKEEFTERYKHLKNKERIQ